MTLNLKQDRHSCLSLLFCFLFTFCFVSRLQAEDKPAKQELPVEVSADTLEYDKAQKKIVGKGNVLVTYRDLKLQADRAEVYTDSKKAVAEGHVTVIDKESTLSGEKGEYDFKNHSGSFPQGTGYQYPWYAYGEEINQVSKDEIRIKNGVATTCNYDRPHYDIIAKDVTLYPNDKLVLRNAFVRILGKRVLWLPYLSIPLDKRDSPLEIQAGYSSRNGFYVYTAKGFSLSREIKFKGHLDYRNKRGIAWGVDSTYDVPEFGRGKVITYFADDKNAPQPTDPDNPFTETEDRRRYRVTVRHRTDFGPRSNVIVNWNKFSDEFVLQDFFHREDRRETRQRSQVVFTDNKDDYGMFAEVVKQTNKFFSEVEKLPRLNFQWKEQPLFDTNMLYKNELQFTNFQKKRVRSDSDDDVVRADTSHEFFYPFQVFDKRIKITPYANVRGAYYSKNREGEDTLTRGIFGNGVEARTRFQRTFDYSTDFMKLNINKIRHILEPVFRYDAIRYDSADPEKLFPMDEFDALHHHDVLTFALDNRFQTKRQLKDRVQRVDIVSYNQFINYELDGGRDGGGSFTDWGHEVAVRPYSWLLFESKTVFDVSSTDFKENLVDLVVEPRGKRVRLILSDSYLREDPFFGEGSETHVMTADLMFKINKLWKVGGYVRSEFATGNLEEWEVRAVRDLHDFLLTFGINARNSDVLGDDRTNTEAFAELRMKAFPGVGYHVGNRSSITYPRIGRYYGGSNIDEKYIPSSPATL